MQVFVHCSYSCACIRNKKKTLLFYSKEQLRNYYKELWLKTWREKKDPIETLSRLGSLRKIPVLINQKFEQRTVELAFPTEYWGMISEWVHLFLQKVKWRLPKSNYIMDSLFGPRNVKNHTFPTSIIRTPLKRTIGCVPLVFVLKKFGCI